MSFWPSDSADKPYSLARRLARTLITWVGGIWLVCLLGVVGFVNHEINTNFDHEMVEIANRMFDIALRDLADTTAEKQAQIAAVPLIGTNDPVVFQLVNDQLQILMRSHVAPVMRYPVPLKSGFANTPGWRVYTVKHPEKPLFFHLADRSRDRRIARNRTLYGLLVPLGAMLLVLPLLLRTIARRELAVLKRLETQIAERSGADLRPVALGNMPQELTSVGEHVNRLLSRLSHALDIERALAANAAHELRTPLAAVRLRLETALETGLAGPEVEAALASLATLSQRTEKLLQLSRAESGEALAQHPVKLEQLAATVAEEFWALPALRDQVTLELPDSDADGQTHIEGAAGCDAGEGQSPGMLQLASGDLDSLAIALRNLVENALHYGAGSTVCITVVAPCTVVVRDHGPGVAAQQLAALTQRHVRNSSERTGYGLGLSIIGTIMEKHHGRLELYSPLPHTGEPGFEARLVLAPFDRSGIHKKHGRFI